MFVFFFMKVFFFLYKAIFSNTKIRGDSIFTSFTTETSTKGQFPRFECHCQLETVMINDCHSVPVELGWLLSHFCVRSRNRLIKEHRFGAGAVLPQVHCVPYFFGNYMRQWRIDSVLFPSLCPWKRDSSSATFGKDRTEIGLCLFHSSLKTRRRPY